MKCTILHESRGRMRVHVNAVRMTLHRADVLEAYLNHSEVIEHAKVYERTGDVLIQYKGSRAGAVTVLSHYKFDNPELDSLVTSADSRKINQEYQERFVNLVVFRAFHKLFLPAPVRAVITVFKAIEFICRGLVCLWHRKLEVEVLDALSIGVRCCAVTLIPPVPLCSCSMWALCWKNGHAKRAWMIWLAACP